MSMWGGGGGGGGGGGEGETIKAFSASKLLYWPNERE